MKLITETDKSTRANVLLNVLREYTKCNSIREFQAKMGLTVDGLFGNRSYDALYNYILDTVWVSGFQGHFFPHVSVKRQIVWHHSAGWDNARTMFSGWANDGVTHVATAIGITDDGRVYRGFEEDYWAHHIGMSNAQNLARNQQSVAVEVCNWGALMERGGVFYTWVSDYGRRGRAVTLDKSKVIALDYKGFKHYEVYTDAEIESLKRWTLLMAIRYDIPLAYSPVDMWEVSPKAIMGKAGIYTHNSYISWKSDVSPQPKLIAMAEGLEEYEKTNWAIRTP